MESNFHEIFSETKELNSALSEINNSIREMNLGSGEISQSMMDLNNSTMEILKNNETIGRDITNSGSSIKNIYQIGNTIYGQIEDLNDHMSEIRSVVEKVKNLSTNNGEMIEALKGELGKIVLEKEASGE
jgi:methyl-accepting chemotaxis protein